MATFKTDYERVKWTKLEKQASLTFDRLKKGTATKEDLKVAQFLVTQYGDLATNVFNSGVDAINRLAETRIKEIEAHREKLNKPKLTDEQLLKLQEQAVSKAIKDEGVELILAIEDIINKGNTELQSKFDTLIKPTTQEQPEDTITLGKVHSLLMDIAKKPYPGFNRPVEPTNRARESLFTRATGNPLNMPVSQPDREFEVNSDAATQYLKSRGLLQDNEAVEPKEDLKVDDTKAKDIKDALKGNTEVSKKIAEMLRDVLNPEQFKKAMKAINEKDTEDNKSLLNKKKHANQLKNKGFFKSLSSWVSRRYDSVASKVSRLGHKFTGGGLIGLLTKAFILQLAGGDVLGEIKKFADPKDIQKYAEEAYNWLGSKFRELKDWVTNKLAPKDVPKQETITPKDTPKSAIAKANRNAIAIDSARKAAQARLDALLAKKKANPNLPHIDNDIDAAQNTLSQINIQSKINQEAVDKAQLDESNTQQGLTKPQPVTDAKGNPVTDAKGHNPIVDGKKTRVAKTKPNVSNTTVNTSVTNPLHINTSSASIPAYNPDTINTGTDFKSLTKAQGATVGSMQSTPDFEAATDPSFIIFNHLGLLHG